MPSRNKSTDILGTYHIAQHPELYTPSRDNNFVLYINLPEELLMMGVNEDEATDVNRISGDKAQEVLALSVNESAVPHSQQNVIEVKRGNGTVKFAGAVTYPSGSFKFNDYIGAGTKTILLAIRKLSFDESDETVGRAQDYKLKATLVEYTPDHRQIRYWDYYGFWCSELSENPFSSDSDGKREITATFQYDRAIPHLPDDLEEVTFTSGQ